MLRKTHARLSIVYGWQTFPVIHDVAVTYVGIRFAVDGSDRARTTTTVRTSRADKLYTQPPTCRDFWTRQSVRTNLRYDRLRPSFWRPTWPFDRAVVGPARVTRFFDYRRTRLPHAKYNDATERTIISSAGRLEMSLLSRAPIPH